MTVNVLRPFAQGYGVAIGDEWFRVAPKAEVPILIDTVDSLAKRQDQTGSAGENVLEIGYGFSRPNLTGGEGLDWYPRIAGEAQSPLDEIRFWDSENIDIRRPASGNPYLLGLVKDVATFYTPAGTPVDMGFSRDALYVAEGTNVQRFDNLTDATPEDTQNIGVTLVNIDVGLDDTVLAVDNTGDVWIKPDRSDSYIKLYDTATDGKPAVAAWWVKGRAIVATLDSASADYGDVVEVDPVVGGTPAAPTVTPVISTLDTYSGSMNDCIDAGHAIVAAFSDGSIRSYVARSDTAGGTPSLTIRGRSQVPDGENPTAFGWNLGQLFIFTLAEAPTTAAVTARVYTAQILDERFDFVMGGLQLLRVWEGADETAPDYVKNIVSTRDEIFFMVGEASSEWNLWRYDLVTQGLFRHHNTSQGAGDGLAIFDGRILYIDGANVLAESSTDYVAEGYLITPNITFGLNTPINWTSFVLEAENLAVGGVKVEFYRSTDPDAILDPNHAGWVLTETYTDPAQSGIEKSVVNTQANQMAMMIKLFRSTNRLATPQVPRFAVRGLPKHRDWVATVPINISDMVTAPNRMPMRVFGKGDTDHETIVGLQGASTTLQLLDPPITIRGIVDRISEPVDLVADRGSMGRYCIVRFLGNLVGTDPNAAVQGNAGMGIATMGIATMGIGEVS